MSFTELLHAPWPWYVAGPLIGLMVPLLLIVGNKSFGISSSFRHICAASFPARIRYFKYNWKKETWNLLFVAGIIAGAIITTAVFKNEGSTIHPDLATQLHSAGITDFSGMMPPEIFNWKNLFSMQGFIMMVVGGFLIGFGTRYAGGCTSGHSITGLSNLQWPSLVATICFMIGGFLSANFFVPFILKL